MKTEVRIVVLGDAKVGKTSLITSLISGSFHEKVAPVVPIVTIPADATADKVTTHIIDTSSRPSEFEKSVKPEIQQADCFVIVYAVDDEASFKHIESYWLPTIRKIRLESSNPTNLLSSLASMDTASTESVSSTSSTISAQMNGDIPTSAPPTPIIAPRVNQTGAFPPVILVGNKIDLRGEEHEGDLEETMRPIITNFREVETAIECSALTCTQLEVAFSLAQKSVLYPTGVLHDPIKNRLTPECLAALRRIFVLCDKDNDGLLNFQEMKAIQEKVFSTVITQDDFDGIVSEIRQKLPEGISNKGITVAGFIFLQHSFISIGQLEATWIMLRKFGYDDDLKLREDFLCPPLTVKPHQTVELSDEGYHFFKDLFKKFDKDQDGALSPGELTNLFSTSPGQPWGKQFPNSVVTTENNYVTLQGFLAQWSMTTLLDYKTTLRYLTYLGFDYDPSSVKAGEHPALTVTKGKKKELETRKVARNVFQCFVFGSPGCGKTTFLNGLIEKPFEDEYKPTTETRCAVNSIEVEGKEYYLVLREIAKGEVQQVIENRETMDKCDLVCLLYDAHNPKSFSYIAKLQELLWELGYHDIPCVYFRTKSDLEILRQDFELTPEEFCKTNQLVPPTPVTFKLAIDRYLLYSSIAQDIVARYESSSSGNWIPLAALTTIILVLGIGGFVYWRTRR